MTRTIAVVAAWGLAAALAGCSNGDDGGGGGPPPGPTLGLSRAAVAFATTESGGVLPAAETVAVTNSGGGTLPTPVLTVSYAGAATGWLDVSVVAAGAGYTLTLRPSTTALEPATHAATVQVACAGASGSPRSVTVSWQLTANPNPVIAVSPIALAFAGEVGGADPAAQTIAVSNGGSGTLGALSVTTHAAWLGASVSGSTVTVTASVGSLAAGVHSGHVEVSAAGAANSPVSVPVTLTVGVPTLAVAPASLSFAATAGGTPPAQTVEVTNSGTGTLAAPIATPAYATGSGWMSATVAGGGNAYTVTVAVAAPATAGTYTGSISIASASATNSPVVVAVTLTVGSAVDLSTLGSAVRTLYGAYLDRLAACYPYAPWFVTWSEAMVADLAATLEGAQTLGRIDYARAQAESCDSWIAGATCPQLEESFGTEAATCGALVVGLVANGGTCDASLECANGYCTSDVSATCPGLCTAFAADGNACSDWVQCASGACDGTTCVADAPGGQGQACGYGDLACQSGLYCDASSVCRQRLAAGGDCSLGDECAFGLGCAADGTCRTLVGVGADCTSATCGEGLYCSAGSGSTCAAFPGLGESCAELGFCYDGSHCSSASTCVAGTVPVGNACDPASDLFCVAGAYCFLGNCVAVPTDACY
jgi:hypothetical protein